MGQHELSADRHPVLNSAGDIPDDQPATAQPAPAQPAPDERLERIEAALAGVRDELRLANDRAAARERIIDRLHEDNQKLRAGEHRLLLRPILADLQRLRNELLKVGAAAADGFSDRQIGDLLTSFAHSVELTLERGGVQVVRPSVDAPFDPARHRAAGVVPAPTQALDGTVGGVVGDGYADVDAERVLAPATVLVRRWTEPPAGPDGAHPVTE